MSFAGRIRVALLFTLGLLGPVHVSGAAAAPAAAPGSRAGVPMTLSVGVTEDVSSLMRRQALLNATGGVLRDAERDVEQPDRSSLPQNPASPLSASTGGSPAGLGPIRDLGPFTPQTIGTSFTAATLSGTNPTLSFPPDCMGAVGPTQMVVFVNGRLVTFNKTTGVADGVLNLNPDVFFVSVRNGSSTSDPRIRYDRLTGRWFLVIINVSTPNRILIAVSDAASAGVISGSTVFTYFFINIATLPPTISSTCLADYPTLGVDANALYIGTNNFCGSPIQSFNSTDGYVIRKSSILGAGPMVVTVFRGLVATSGSTGPYTPQGVDNFDPAATEGYFIGVDNLSYGLLQMRRVSSPGGTPAISANVPITVSATSAPLRVPHLGNTGGANGQLSALDDRLFAAHIRGGKLWTAHNIGVNNTGVASGTITRDGSRWYQLTVPPVSGTPTVTQSGTVYTATATNLTTERFYWIPSVMVSGQGHVAMGLSTSGSNERANSAALGRFPGDPAGTMQAATLFSSSATAYNPPSDPGGSNGRRWGDYSYTSVDPLDDQTMWTVQMFCDATNSYGVRVAKLVPPPPATPATVADVTAGQNPVTVTLTGTSVTGSSFFDPGPDLPGVPAFHHLSASISNTGVTGTPPTVVSATYVDSVTVSLVLNASAATANLVGEKYTVTVTNPDGQTAAAAVLRVVAPAAPTVSVTSPVGGETWAMGSSHNITWTASSGAAITGVDLAYSTDGGATYPNVIATGLANSGSYAWTVPSVATSTARVRATAHDANSQSGSGSSPADFTIADQSAPSVSISSPLGGEVWGMASSHNITWTATDNVGVVAVDLAYSTDGGSTYPNVIATGLANSGSYAWTVPSIASTTLRVRVTAADAAANSASAASPGNFTVADQTVPSVAVTAPVGGETWAMGSSRNITWTATDNVGVTAVDLAYSTDGGATYPNPIATGLANSGAYAWAVPNVASATARVRVTARDAALNSAAAASPADFAIADSTPPAVTLTSPVGGETWAMGSGHNLTWTATDNVAVTAIDLAYSTDGGATYPNVIATGIANSGSHPWTVPATATATARVRATAHDAAANTAASSSPADFAIADQASPVVTVTSPSGGEDWAMGSGHNITWTATDNVAVTDVDLAYSTDGGATYPNTIATGIANSGSYAWTVPGVPTAAARVRVTAHDGASNATSAASAANFTISDQAPPSASLTAPAGGETWAVGSGQNITWTATDNVGVTSVDLAYSTDGGATYAHPIGTGIANSGSYAWTVPATPSTTARVRVTAHDAASNSASASSAADFAIADQSAPAVAVASPVGGEAWYEGSAHNINWTATDDVGVASVSLDYSRHGAGGPWIPVASGLANTGSYPWTLPGPATDSAFVRVRALDAASNTGTAQSDSAFHILPPLDTMAPVVVVTSPVGGESWVGGSTHNVTWTATDNVGVDSVNVDYSLTGTGGAWITLAHSLANSGSYPWLLPAVLSDSAVVRVTAFDHAVNAAADLGDSLFHITASAVGVGGPRPTVFTLYRPSPNPARGSVELRFHIVRSGDATAEIFSVGGSRVWHSFMPGVGAGEHRVAWDGRGSSGERVTSGLYFVRVSCAEGVRTARMVRLP